MRQVSVVEDKSSSEMLHVIQLFPTEKGHDIALAGFNPPSSSL